MSQALSLDESYEARSGGTLARVVTITAYSVLGVILCATRLVGLDRGFWHDEIVAVEGFIRAGPRQILAGPDLSHELFSLLAWSTGSIVESRRSPIDCGRSCRSSWAWCSSRRGSTFA